MDRISGLPDDLLVKILSLAPTDVAFSTWRLSKRWKFIWLWLPNLNFFSISLENQKFIDKYLRLHRGPVIESLSLYLNGCTQPEAVKRWVEIAVSCHVRKMEIIDFLECANILPSSFYTSKSLVILKLERVTLKEIPSMACLHSLKTLKLLYVDTDDKSFQELLSICPILEELFVKFRKSDEEDVTKFTIAIPSLQSLSLFISHDWVFDGYEIDSPSLKYFKLEDWNEEEHYSKIKNLPKLVEADINVRYEILENVIGSITCVKRLTTCPQLIDIGLTDTGINAILDNFPHLEHLDLSKCSDRNLSGYSEKRCVERVKEFRRPRIDVAIFAYTDLFEEEVESEIEEGYDDTSTDSSE